MQESMWSYFAQLSEDSNRAESTARAASIIQRALDDDLSILTACIPNTKEPIYAAFTPDSNTQYILVFTSRKPMTDHVVPVYGQISVELVPVKRIMDRMRNNSALKGIMLDYYDPKKVLLITRDRLMRTE